MALLLVRLVLWRPGDVRHATSHLSPLGGQHHFHHHQLPLLHNSTTTRRRRRRKQQQRRRCGGENLGCLRPVGYGRHGACHVENAYSTQQRQDQSSVDEAGYQQPSIPPSPATPTTYSSRSRFICPVVGESNSRSTRPVADESQTGRPTRPFKRRTIRLPRLYHSRRPPPARHRYPPTSRSRRHVISSKFFPFLFFPFLFFVLCSTIRRTFFIILCVMSGSTANSRPHRTNVNSRPS